MLHLYQHPSIYVISSLVSFTLSMLFHVIAFSSDNWCYFDLDEKRVHLGLWRGCWEVKGSWECSSKIFENGIFSEGYSWHIGARVLMIVMLISLLLLEFALIGFGCIREFEPQRERLLAVIMGFSAAAGISSAIVLHLMSAEPRKLPNGQLGWSYSFHIISFLAILITFTLVVIDLKFKESIKNILSRRLKSTQDKGTKNEPNSNTFSTIPAVEMRMQPEAMVESEPVTALDSISNCHDNLSYRSGSYAYIPDNYSYSDITVSTDVVSYSQEPGRFRSDTLEWDV